MKLFNFYFLTQELVSMEMIFLDHIYLCNSLLFSYLLCFSSIFDDIHLFDPLCNRLSRFLIFDKRFLQYFIYISLYLIIVFHEISTTYILIRFLSKINIIALFYFKYFQLFHSWCSDPFCFSKIRILTSFIFGFYPFILFLFQ